MRGTRTALHAITALLLATSSVQFAPAIAADKVRPVATTTKPPKVTLAVPKAPKPTKTTDAQLLAAQAAWDAAYALFKQAQDARTQALATINTRFTEAVNQAKSAYKAAKAKATSSALKITAETMLKAAIEAATVARKIAIDALPALPVDPGPRPTSKS